MNRNKLSKLIVCGLLMITVFSFIPVVNVQAGTPGYLWKKPGWTPDTGNRIWNWWFPWVGIDGDVYIDKDDWSFFRMGWAVSDYEIEMGYDPGPPYQMKLFINGEEIVMKRFSYSYKEELFLFPDGVERDCHVRVWIWTVRFEPGYFEEGKTYEIREIFLVQKPYQESNERGWRPYENYMSGGDPGAPYSWEDWYGPIGIENDIITYLHAIEF